MTSTIFFEWLQSFNLNMAVENRKVILLVDNASSHKVVKTLSNVEVHFFPPNLTSSVQPLDSGIIRLFKARYRRRFVRWCIDAFESNIKRKLNVFEAIQFSIDSWGDVSADCIRNCWVKARIVNAVVMAELRQAGNYSVTAEQKVIDNLANMLEGTSVSEYLGVDADIDVHEFPENAINHHVAVVSDDEDDPEENESPPVSASTALAYCMELSHFFFQCEGDTKREQEMLQCLTMLARTQVVKRRRQTSLDKFLTPM
ncbi:CENPB protein Homeodomainlike [Phytophthora megakarya]|uniref:CENPB protein Homeodomainlike n=1 Tax=Phytophthora megakarya TaxID=4795 RepID=A0A225V3B3_9STRA|nr:CENPB protein Homeodomainlike [Phytophthora megakarya]